MKRLLISLMIIFTLCILYLMLVYFPSKFDSSTPIPIDESTTTPVLSFGTREMTSITPHSSTSTVQDCMATADEEYFDGWSRLCEQDADNNKFITYAHCLELATTSPDKSNVYNQRTMIERPTPQECEFLKDKVVFNTNCSLPDDKGKEATLKWQESVRKCNER